ncbi:VOC family protein [Segetibacter aerophilus]|uniref:VOC domain-containing protein n=1 Tax=Segetibacter aerophilus TaxID=670293 RepID=A0A512BEI3_9BACT|nr:hypothetical protein [Segetibacter aerophilus]GEO10371.1 hypothetical protein SAE01_28670 [Segetibacter aerophilus]
MLIKEISLLTNDLVATERFYSDILQFAIYNKTASRISFSVGHSMLSFTYTERQNPFYHFAFSIPSNKVDEAHRFIADKIEVLPFTPGTTIADFSNWNAHAFYFHDNQKNIVEFIAHHDLHNDTNEPFTPSDIIGICEIGVPVEDVTEACKMFNEKYGLQYFVKGPRLQDFSVMGDTQGLFIVTKIGRGWLPTQQPAERFDTKVVFENNGQVAELIL